MTTPRIKKSDKEWLYRALSDGKWRKSRTMQMPHRTIRAVCEADPQTFMSGQKGYKLVRYATDEEMRHAIADLRSRAKHITQRAEGLETALHRRLNTGQNEMFA